MSTVMERPVLVPFRWPAGRNLDIRTCIIDDQLLFAAADITRAFDPTADNRHLELRRRLTADDPELLDAPTVTTPTVVDDHGRPIAFYTVDVVRELADDRPLALLGDGFLDWFEELVDTLTGDRLREFVAGTKHPEPGQTADETYSVARAARILSFEPRLSFGEKSLFAALEHLGWITRVDGRWKPVDERLAMGHLTTLTTTIAPLRERYDQVRITPDGLHELRTALQEYSNVLPVLVEP